MNAQMLAKPDNGADVTINLAISGNRLVSILNTVDSLAFQAGVYAFEGNAIKTVSSWYDDLRATTEAVRDELSRQRCAARG